MNNLTLVMNKKANNLFIFNENTNRGEDIELELQENDILNLKIWKINSYVDDTYKQYTLTRNNVRKLYKTLLLIRKILN